MSTSTFFSGATSPTLGSPNGLGGPKAFFEFKVAGTGPLVAAFTLYAGLSAASAVVHRTTLYGNDVVSEYFETPLDPSIVYNASLDAVAGSGATAQVVAKYG